MSRLIIWLHGVLPAPMPPRPCATARALTAYTRLCVCGLVGLGDTGAGWEHLKSELSISGVNYLHPDAPTNPVSCNGGFKMTSWMDLDDIPVTLQLPDDEAGLKASSKIIHDLIDQAVAQGTPSTSIIVGGFSQGGAMALLAGYSYHQPLAGVVCFSGWPALKESLVERVKGSANSATPAFIGHGTADGLGRPMSPGLDWTGLDWTGLHYYTGLHWTGR